MATAGSRRPSAWHQFFPPKAQWEPIVQISELENSSAEGGSSEGPLSSPKADLTSPRRPSRVVFVAPHSKDRRQSRLFSVSTAHTAHRSTSFADSIWSAADSTHTRASSIVPFENEKGDCRLNSFSENLHKAPQEAHTSGPVHRESEDIRAEPPTLHKFRFGVDHPALEEPSPSRSQSLYNEPVSPGTGNALSEDYLRFCTDEPRRKLQKRRSLTDVNPGLNPQRKWYGSISAPDSTEDDEKASPPYETEDSTAARVRVPTHNEAEPAPSPANGRPLIPAIDGTDHQLTKPLTFNTTQLPLRTRLVDVDGSLRAQGRRKILTHKYVMQGSIIGINGFLIFGTWRWLQYYYLFLPLICAPVLMNVLMVFSIILHNVLRPIWPVKIIMPKEPESLVLLIPCYNETKEELTKSLDSLIAQQKIDNHPQAIIIICDGKVRGPGMEKTTGDYLLQDILLDRASREYISGAYTAWDQQPMDIVIQRGKYKGIPYYCIIKQQNQGKRDSLIAVRSFLYNFNRRTESPGTVFSPKFFDSMASFMLEDAAIENVVHLIGMDADTVFDDHCIYELLQQSRFPNTVGVCGYVAVDWKDNKWDLWKLYQSAEYTIAQGLRRLHQSIVTHKVSCLPGCCQLLRICEETCGDDVLIDKFGYCPNVTDGLIKQIRATASEDRNHVCNMLIERPKAQTRQALKAKAYTDVPNSWSVFLSQRRRWSLGATSNDVLLMSATSGVQWFERILALTNVTTWFLNLFIFAAIASFIYAATIVPVWIIMCFVSVMLIPIVYYLVIPLWLCKKWVERLQFWVGCWCYICGGPFINIFTLLYACVYMDSFGWGKTRKVVADDAGDSTQNELERLAEGDIEKKVSSDESTGKVEAYAMPPITESEVEHTSGMRDLDTEEKRIGG